jgi:uncharacterized membrane protein YphA (DoxX/SURF4 family)
MTTLTASIHKIREWHGLEIALWVAQIALLGVFAMAGVMKTFTPIAELSKSIAWTAEVPVAMVRFIGICEIAGALGLILPAAFKFLPGYLTPMASLGLLTIMTLAVGFHGMRGETAMTLPVNIILGAIALFVAWGRFFKFPIHPHT